MSLKDYKVSDAVAQAQGVVSLPDRPSESGISAAELKAIFDRLAHNVVGANLNSVIDVLTSTAGANEIGAVIAGMNGATVAEILLELAEKATQAQTHLQETNNPHKVTAEQTGAVGTAQIADSLDESDQTKIPTVKAVNDGISFAGGGDMMKNVYDPQRKAEDIFAYADRIANAAKLDANAYTAGKIAEIIVPSATSELTNDSDFTTNAALAALETELKNSVGNGKTLVADAITAKGVTTATDATFETMAENIAQIATGAQTAYGTGTGKGTSSQVHYVQVTGLPFSPSKVLIWFEDNSGGASFKFITKDYVITQVENSYGYDKATRGEAGSDGTSFTSTGFRTNFTGRSGDAFYYFAIE